MNLKSILVLIKRLNKFIIFGDFFEEALKNYII